MLVRLAETICRKRKTKIISGKMELLEGIILAGDGNVNVFGSGGVPENIFRSKRRVIICEI